MRDEEKKKWLLLSNFSSRYSYGRVNTEDIKQFSLLGKCRMIFMKSDQNPDDVFVILFSGKYGGMSELDTIFYCSSDSCNIVAG